jgi:exonuclease SbcD
MRILHTADWHLGHRLYGNDRATEHRQALDWLLELIERERAELLIVAGDVFDTMNPSNAARNLYYDFLGRLRATGCHSAVIVGGNHDSPPLMDAPADLLRHLDVHVVGGARERIEDQLVPIYRSKQDKEPALIVAAVPFLRDRDLKYSVIGESAGDKVRRMRESIRTHYREIAAAAETFRPHAGVPIVGTGHLFASGATDAEDKETHIYLADRSNISATEFADCFDYVALGHIHRGQRVGGMNHIRYPGSLIPLTFGEARGPQWVLLTEVNKAGSEVAVTKHTVPVGRQLTTLSGTPQEVEKELRSLADRQRGADACPSCPWVDIRVESPHPVPLLREKLSEICAPNEADEIAGIEELPRILRTRWVSSRSETEETQSVLPRDLAELQPEEVFYQLCHNDGPEREDYPELLETLRELRDWMTQREVE